MNGGDLSWNNNYNGGYGNWGDGGGYGGGDGGYGGYGYHQNRNKNMKREEDWSDTSSDKEKEGYYPTREEIREDTRMLGKLKPEWMTRGYGYGGWGGGYGGGGFQSSVKKGADGAPAEGGAAPGAPGAPGAPAEGGAAPAAKEGGFVPPELKAINTEADNMQTPESTEDAADDEDADDSSAINV